MSDPEITQPPARKTNWFYEFMRRFSVWHIAQVSGALLVAGLILAFIAGAIVF